MRKAKDSSKIKKEFQLSNTAKKVIEKLHETIVKEVTKMDKKIQKNI
jgi:hypothetical protein